MISDLISLPVNESVTGSSDPIRQETVEARGLDVIVWYDLPETNKTTTVAETVQAGLWTARLSAEQFAAEMQASIVPSTGDATPAA